MVVTAHSCTSQERPIRSEGWLDPVRCPLRVQIVMLGVRVFWVRGSYGQCSSRRTRVLLRPDGGRHHRDRHRRQTGGSYRLENGTRPNTDPRAHSRRFVSSATSRSPKTRSRMCAHAPHSSRRRKRTGCSSVRRSKRWPRMVQPAALLERIDGAPPGMAASLSCRQCSASMWTTSTLESRCDWSSTPPTPAPAALILVEQLPRSCRYRLPLEPDSSCRGVQRSLRLLFRRAGLRRGIWISVGSAVPIRPIHIWRGVSPRTVSRFGRSARCAAPTTERTPDEGQPHHRPWKEAMHGVRPSPQ